MALVRADTVAMDAYEKRARKRQVGVNMVAGELSNKADSAM